MVRVTTSIKIDNDKRELAKRRGLVLSDILDQALDIALGIELKESTKLMESKEDLKGQKELLENEKDKFLKDHEIKLENLENEKDQFLKDHETKINEIDFKIKNIDKALESAIIEDKEEIKQKEYNQLLRRAIKIGGLDDLDLTKDIEEYADKYEMSDTEYEELQQRLIADIWANWGRP